MNLDEGVKAWTGKILDVLNYKFDHPKLHTYYYMPIFKSFLADNVTLNSYLRLTKEKRSGSLPFLKTCIILLEYIFYLFRRLLKIRKATILLPKIDSYFAVFFGNHRVRFTSLNFDIDMIIDVTEGTPIFNSRSIKAFNSDSNSFPPLGILSNDQRIITEERLNGIALNRMMAPTVKCSERKFITYYIDYLNARKIKIPIKGYLESFERKLSYFMLRFDFAELMPKELKESLTIESNRLVNYLSTCDSKFIEIAPSHRDLNRGNILVSTDNSLRVIDTEFFDSAFYLYDIFILMSDYRHNQDVSKSIANFREEIEFFNVSYHKPDLCMIFLEEINFFIDNYSVRQSKNLRDLKVITSSLLELSEGGI